MFDVVIDRLSALHKIAINDFLRHVWPAVCLSLRTEKLDSHYVIFVTLDSGIREFSKICLENINLITRILNMKTYVRL